MPGPRLLTINGDRCGGSHPKAKLTDEQVYRMRDLNAQGASCTQLARHFETSWHTVRSICAGKRRNARL